MIEGLEISLPYHPPLRQTADRKPQTAAQNRGQKTIEDWIPAFAGMTENERKGRKLGGKKRILKFSG